MKEIGTGYAVGDRVELTIERIVPGGFGLGRGPSGIVLVELAAPGDVADVEIRSLRGGVAHGTIASLRESSPERVDAPCRWYGICGGCDFQHLRYEGQLDAKVAMVVDALARVGRIEWNGPIERFAAPRPFGGRTRVELHTDVETGAVGFYARRSNRVVDIDRCIVSSDRIGEGIGAVRSAKVKPPKSIQLLASQQEVRSAPTASGLAHGAFWLDIAGIEYQVDPAGFFQSSLDLLPALIDRVVGFANEGDLIWDLFCGVGLFSLPLAKKCQAVVGVELESRAIRQAATSATQNGIVHVRFEAAEVAAWLRRRHQQQTHPDTIVVDPPRTGLGRDLSQLVAQKLTQQLVYVSCDPVTLARDLQTLTSTGMQIVDIAVFDLFPQTHHVETVVRLARMNMAG